MFKIIQKYFYSSNIPRQFASVNVNLDRTLWDYENYTILYGIQDDYEIFQKIGRGKYSEVFNGINVVSNQDVIIKMLKPNQPKKHQREILVLNRLRDHQNITTLEDVVMDSVCGTKSLIYKDHGEIALKTEYPRLNPIIIKNIIYQVCIALLYAHQNGIFHRDIKPQNILVDKNLEKARLIDWGLAEFYHPNKEYNVRVASRYFKAPEIMLDFRLYNYSLDTWSLGVLLAGMIFMQEPFIAGKSNDDQLIQTVKLCGSKDLDKYLHKYDIVLPQRYNGVLGRYQKKPLIRFINEKNQQFCSPEVIDLLEKLLVYDHIDRLTITEVMQHSYFDEVRKKYKN